MYKTQITEKKRDSSTPASYHTKRSSVENTRNSYIKKMKHESDSSDNKRPTENDKEYMEASRSFMESDPNTWKICFPEVIAKLKHLGVTSLRANQYDEYVLVIIEGTDTTPVFNYLQNEVYKRDVVIHDDHSLKNKYTALKRTIPVF